MRGGQLTCCCNGIPAIAPQPPAPTSSCGDQALVQRYVEGLCLAGLPERSGPKVELARHASQPKDHLNKPVLGSNARLCIRERSSSRRDEAGQLIQSARLPYRAAGGGWMPRRGRSGLATRRSSKPTATTGIQGGDRGRALVARGGRSREYETKPVLPARTDHRNRAGGCCRPAADKMNLFATSGGRGRGGGGGR